jgi:methylated-DNA-[protein]-cysteine S-methyltransferase
MNHFYKLIQSPVGPLKLIASDEGLVAIQWENEKARSAKRWSHAIENARHPILLGAEEQLGRYFSGKLKRFHLKLDVIGTDFQKQVWKTLQTIPFGDTVSYGELARRLRKPSASRAVGGANGRNPIPIVVPCHRVIGASGKLTGFAGGVERKALLLELEGRR